MAELTMIIDSSRHEELEKYLLSLKGILEVTIKNENNLEIYVKYDSSLITSKIIKFEILLFLDIYKFPSILAFDKHPSVKISNYKMIKYGICCEECLKNAVEELFEIEGIERVETDFSDISYNQDVIIDISYNPFLISAQDIKQIELKLNI